MTRRNIDFQENYHNIDHSKWKESSSKVLEPVPVAVLLAWYTADIVVGVNSQSKVFPQK